MQRFNHLLWQLFLQPLLLLLLCLSSFCFVEQAPSERHFDKESSQNALKEFASWNKETEEEETQKLWNGETRSRWGKQQAKRRRRRKSRRKKRNTKKCRSNLSRKRQHKAKRTPTASLCSKAVSSDWRIEEKQKRNQEKPGFVTRTVTVTVTVTVLLELKLCCFPAVNFSLEPDKLGYFKLLARAPESFTHSPVFS